MRLTCCRDRFYIAKYPYSVRRPIPKSRTGRVSATTISSTVVNYTPRAITNVIGMGGNTILSGTTLVSTTSANTIGSTPTAPRAWS